MILIESIELRQNVLFERIMRHTSRNCWLFAVNSLLIPLNGECSFFSSLSFRGEWKRVRRAPGSFVLNNARAWKECSLTSEGSRPVFSVFQIAPSAKKLWGVDEGGSKDEGGVKGGGTLLHLGDHQTMWRDSTWSTSGKSSRQSLS